MPSFRRLTRTALALTALAVAGRAARAQQPPLPYQAVTEAYEIHAFAPEALAAAREELDSAAAVFRRHFGAVAPIAVVIVRSAADVTRLDLASFRQRGLLLLPWIGDGGTGAMLGEARALAHEACHLFLIRYVNERRGAGPLGQSRRPLTYGHPAIPDWFDEGIATLCEFAALRSQRYAFLEAGLDGRIPLGELFAMEHPIAATQRELLERLRPAPGEGPRIQRLQLPRESLESELALMFYAQSLSLVEFLAARHGPDAIGRCANALADGHGTLDALGLVAGAPVQVADLERAWLDWLRGRR